ERHERQREGGGQAPQHLARYRRTAYQASAEIAPQQDAAYPVDVLGGKRPVETHLPLQGGNRLGGRLNAQGHAGRASRQQRHDGKRREAHAEQHEEHRAEALEQVGGATGVGSGESKRQATAQGRVRSLVPCAIDALAQWSSSQVSWKRTD